MSACHRTPIALAAVAAALLAVAAGPPASADEAQPTALVTLGDSYISGEAGRWNGNATTFLGSRRGTDRAFVAPYGYAPERVYGDTYGGCDRSDVAPALSAAVPVDARINLACSGATTANVVRAANGGTGQHGEAPQADQLAGVAAAHDVEVVVLSVGGNDLGFASIITTCAASFTTGIGRCAGGQQAVVDARMAAATDGVRRAVADVRTVLAEAGQAPDSYRLVLQTYPSPIPRAAENRYPENDWSRLEVGGCPFWDSDSDWARDSLVPQISSALAGVAAETGAQLLDLSSMNDGRQACSTGSRQSSGSPTGATMEWTRFLTTGLTQGILQESLHPNAYGQQAMGTCYSLLVASPSTAAARCVNTPGAGPEAMRLVPAG